MEKKGRQDSESGPNPESQAWENAKCEVNVALKVRPDRAQQHAAPQQGFLGWDF